MKILVGWDDAEEADLINLYLGASGNDVTLAPSPDGVIGVLQACRQKSLDETLDQLFDASFQFTRGAGRHDDTSVLLMERAERPICGVFLKKSILLFSSAAG